MANIDKILSYEEEQQLLQPIDSYVGAIQQQVNALRADGTDRVIALNNHIAVIKENANYTKEEKKAIIAKDNEELAKAKAVEAQNKAQINSLIADAISFLDKHYESDYYTPVVKSCKLQKAAEESRYADELAELKAAHEKELA